MPERASAARSLGFLARLGHAARGLVFVAMGVLAARAVVTARSVTAGSREALGALLREPHGSLIVAVVAGGLFADAIFRAVEGAGRRRSLLFRLGRWARAAGAAILGVTALGVGRHLRTAGSADGARHAAQWVLRQTWGPRALILSGAIAGVIAAAEIFRGVTGRFREGYRRKSMSRFEKTWAGRVTRLGLAAHGAVVAVIAFYLVRAGLEIRARDVIDSGTALRRIASLPMGTGILAGIALGLAAYGLSEWILALYRKA